MPEDERADELYARFVETDEMLDWEEFVQAAGKALKASPEAEKVTVPAAFLRRVIVDIATTPHMFRAYHDRFNQLCEEMGMPEQKIPTAGPGPEDMVSQRKFTVRSKPIYYKTRAEEDEGSDDEKGPF